MKKIFIFFTVFFWSMIFPNLSFNNFTTDIVSNEVQYSDLFNKYTRREIIQNAKFDFWFHL